MKIPKHSKDIFHYSDANTSRAGIADISKKLEGQKIAIIGLGGTGSYILDFVAKTHVAEIHLFDDDSFLNHNAFRAPGAVSCQELEQGSKKTDYFTQVYSKMRKGIVSHEIKIDNDNVNQLDGMDFVFVSIDSPSAKKTIFRFLTQNNIPFVDVGMGIRVDKNRSLCGQLQVALRLLKCQSDKELFDYIDVATDNEDENLYETNIQIAELNALNAVLAVIEWKKYFKFYVSGDMKTIITYNISSGRLFSDGRNSGE